MSSRMPNVRIETFALFVCLSMCGSNLGIAAEESSDDDPLASAEARIEKHRKADALVIVRDADGTPVPDARVSIHQTQHAFLFGCNIFGWGRQQNEQDEAAYRKQFADLLNYATLPFYWPSYEQERGKPQHERYLEVARWCKENGIATKGHPLAWNYADARWFPADTEELRRLQMERIEDCVMRFAGLIDRWDVVNEVTHFDRAEMVKRRAPKHSAMWKEVGQMAFTRECFAHARKAGPNATLLINDYRVDPAYERIIEQLVDDRGKPMHDVIGIQSHMHGGVKSNRWLWDVCERFSRFNVPLHFTETTILSGEQKWQKERSESWLSTEKGESRQAKEVARVYTMLFSHPAVEAITWWDFSDRNAWKRAPAGLIRADMTPKPAYDELMRLIKGTWWTELDAKSDVQGTVKFRGFLGDYEVEVSTPGQDKVRVPCRLTKQEVNRLEINLSPASE